MTAHRSGSSSAERTRGAAWAPRWLLELALFCACALAAAPTFAQAQASVFARLVAGEEALFATLSDRPTREQLARWRTVRAELGWGEATVASRSRSLDEAVRGFEALRAADVLEVELLLLEAHRQSGAVTEGRLQGWRSLVADPPTDAVTLRGRLAQLRLYELDGALSAASATCLGAGSAETWRLIEALAMQEQAAPGRRYRSLREPAPAVDHERVEVALAGPDAPLVAAALLALGGSAPSSGLVLRYEAAIETWRAHCAVQAVEAQVLAPLVDGARWPQVFEQLRALHAEGLLSANWLWRAAIHQYLQASAPAVRDLATLYAQAQPHGEGHAFLFLLSDAVDGEVSVPRLAWPTPTEATNPTWRWVIAELHRVQGRHEEAGALLRVVVDHDADFTAAALGLASTQVQRGHLGAAAITWELLDESTPPVPIYQFWLQRLERRLGERIQGEVE